MKKIGIIFAMKEELDELLKVIRLEKEYQIFDLAFYECIYRGTTCILVESGIGKVNAAVASSILADSFKVRAIINTGIAGSLDADIDIGDIVLATDALEHDMDVTGLGYERGVVPDQDISIYKADDKLRKAAKEVCEKVNPDIKVFEGRVISGDQFISRKDVKDDLVNTFSGMCTEMEGAAIAHTAWLYNIPYLIIRSISDKADDSADMDYPSFQKKAIEHSVKLVAGLMSVLE